MSQGISNKKPGLDSEKLKVVLVLLGDIVAKKKKRIFIGKKKYLMHP